MPNVLDLVCVGSAKIDTFLTLHEANKHLRLLEETKELAIKFGEKIEVKKAEILLGGNAANVAVGASRLGLKTAIVTEIGKDEFAQKIIDILGREKVDISNLQLTQNQQSSFSTIINYKNERTIFSEHVNRKHNFNFDNISSKWIYLTSLGNEWQSAYTKTAEFIEKTKTQLAFNPGTLQIKSGKDSFENILIRTNIIFINKEEAEDLLNLPHQQSEINDLIKSVQKLGPKIVVITDGKNGSTAIDENGNIFKKEIIETKVLEKTGAGDAYSSGFISAIIHGLPIEKAMEWGTRNSTSVIGKVGAQAGLLDKTAIEKPF